MITMEKLKIEKARLAIIEKRLINLQKIEELNHTLNDFPFAIDVTKVEGSFTCAPIHVSLILNDAEQAALAKSMQAVLDIAKARIEKEIERA